MDVVLELWSDIRILLLNVLDVISKQSCLIGGLIAGSMNLGMLQDKECFMHCQFWDYTKEMMNRLEKQHKLC